MYPGFTETAFVTLDLLGLALLAGLAASWVWLRPPRVREAVTAAPRLGLFFWLSLLALFAASVFDLLLRTATLGDVALNKAWALIPRVLAGTDYGAYWIVRVVALAMLALLWQWWNRPPYPAHAAAAAAAVLLAFFISATGHAGDEGVLSAMGVSNTLHVTATCLWGGMVLVYGLAVLPHMRGGRVPAVHVAEAATRLSTLAGLALAVVLATGLYNAWTLVGSLPALWTSDYGRVLLLKLFFVAVMMATGFYNRFFAVPAVQAWAKLPRTSPVADAPVGHLERVLFGDSLVFLVILICAATLGNMTPAVHL